MEHTYKICIKGLKISNLDKNVKDTIEKVRIKNPKSSRCMYQHHKTRGFQKEWTPLTIDYTPHHNLIYTTSNK